jgi:hypothetical protein
LFELFADPRLSSNLNRIRDRHTKRLLVWYIEAFGVLHPWQLNNFLGRVEGLRHFFPREAWLGLGKVFVELGAEAFPASLQRIAAFFNEKVQLGQSMQVEKERVSIRDLLEGIVSVCQALGFQALYILVDDVDEPQYYGDRLDFEPAFQLIRPLAAAPKLLGVPGLVFKFFLPLEIRDTCLRALRLDKFSERTVAWKQEDFELLLQQRLRVCGQESLSGLCDPDLGRGIDESVVRFACEHGHPRALLCVGNELLAEHFRGGSRAPEDRVSRGTWEIAQTRAKEVLQ